MVRLGHRLRRTLAGIVSFAFALGCGAISQQPYAAVAAPVLPSQIVERLQLGDGRTADVYRGGVAEVWSRDRKTITYRRILPPLDGPNVIARGTVLPPASAILAQLRRSPARAYARGEAIVVLRPGMRADDAGVASAFKTLNVDRTQQLFTGAEPGLLPSDLGNVYRLHFTGSSVLKAVARLATLPGVRYASPNWIVLPAHAAPIAIPHATIAQAAREPEAAQTGNVPNNYAVTTSAQSLLNAPGVDAVAAYDTIAREFHQLPGEGEIVTNVSIGDLDDASALGSGSNPRSRDGRGGGSSGPTDPCAGAVSANGPTTILSGNQRYLSLPSMPLIPTYVADANGKLSGKAEVCNTADPTLVEAGLDFSVMAPLPHDRQRGGEQGSGLTDLLGIASGASFRLVVPANPEATIADIDAALLGAAMQRPRPDVITASVGFAFDGQGFPDRYLEEDPLTNALVGSIVGHYGIAVCLSANDGLRTTTNAAVAPSGGSAPTDVARDGAMPTNLDDVAFSSAPSLVFDSGAIDAGGTTLDDVVSAEPQDPANAALADRHAFPVTRWNGMSTFSSGFGSRVDLSAPADNILAMSHEEGGAADAVVVNLSAGTSASAPEVAAATAVALQVARLTHHPFQSVRALRSFLETTGTPVANALQADEPLHVGAQIDVNRAVETLLRQAGRTIAPGAARVAVEQRQEIGLFGGAFVTNTKRDDIDLAGPVDSQTQAPTGDNRFAWITIAPDWQGLSSAAHFELLVRGPRGYRVVSTTRWSRLQPQTLLAAAGLSVRATSHQTIALRYEARDRGRSIVEPLTLGFGPSDGTSTGALPPTVPAVVNGSALRVTYDLTKVRNLTAPSIVVSEPGRVNPSTGFLFHPVYMAALSQPKGTISIPVSKLQGDGIYGVALGLRNSASGATEVSDFAYTHVVTASSDTPAATPLLSSGNEPAGHTLEIPYGGHFTVAWDVSAVRGANGVMLEISAAGPTSINSYDPFNNPGGSIRDHDGIDRGSVYFVREPGARGRVRLDGLRVNLVPTMTHAVRVIPMGTSGAAGEASGVSTVTMDGIVPQNGGTVENGFAIDASGSDGYLTSAQITASGDYESTVEIFDQKTGAITHVAQDSGRSGYYTLGWGVWSGDVGLFAQRDLSVPSDPPSANTFTLMNPVSSGTLAGAWSPPVLNDGVSEIVESAVNSTTGTGLFLSGDAIGSATIPYQVFTSNLANNTFGPTYNVSAALNAGSLPSFALGLAQDTTGNTGIVTFANLTASCGAPLLASVDLASGKVTTFDGPGTGFPLDVAIDTATRKIVYQSQCDNALDIVNLADRTTKTASLPGSSGLYNAVDAKHGLIAVEMAASGAADSGDNNALSPIYIYNERGTLIKTLERFNFFGTGLTVNASNLQLDPATRTGYIFGPSANQIEPFAY